MGKALDIDGQGLRMPDGTLRAFTGVGCYPIVYYTASDPVCAECAHKAGQTEDPSDRDTFLVAADVHWEGEPLSCAPCGKDIESAYGVPGATVVP